MTLNVVKNFNGYPPDDLILAWASMGGFNMALNGSSAGRAESLQSAVTWGFPIPMVKAPIPMVKPRWGLGVGVASGQYV